MSDNLANWPRQVHFFLSNPRSISHIHNILLVVLNAFETLYLSAFSFG